MPLAEGCYYFLQVRQVIVGAGDQMSATHIEPFDLVEQVAKLSLYSLEHSIQGVAVRLAEGVEMQSLDPLREHL